MIYIIIPVFNRWSFTDMCLASLERQTNRKFQTVVVDHGSTDGTSEKIISKYPNVHIVKGNDSMWWSAATNIGIEYALEENATYILTLNNDTIPEPNYIEALYEAISVAPVNSLIGSAAISYETKEIAYLGENANWYLATTSYNHKVIRQRPENGLLSVTHFPGRGLLIPIAVFKEIGLFDERCFPHYMADYDFTLRASSKGFKLFCSWDAQIVTFPDASGANKLKSKKNLKAYRQHLFGMKGDANLPLYIKYGIRHSPLAALPSFLLLGISRRVIGYWIKNRTSS